MSIFAISPDKVRELRARIVEVKEERDAALARCARYEEALQWYANLRCSNYGNSAPSKLGDTARAALAGEREKV